MKNYNCIGCDHARHNNNYAEYTEGKQIAIELAVQIIGFPEKEKVLPVERTVVRMLKYGCHTKARSVHPNQGG